MKNYSLIVPLYLIILIIAIPQLSETIYVPALPSLAMDFNITANLAEYTLTIYLVGFAFGVLIWGNLSDFYGRKPCLIAGLTIYIIACICCYEANNIKLFFVFRFLQAFGGSVGSVLGQAIARDITTLETRGKVFSNISIAIAFAPAVGPVIGGFVIKFYDWPKVFIVLILIAVIIIIIALIKLPETNQNLSLKKSILHTYKECFLKIICDKRILGFAFLVGAVNGILFGYFAESPFYFIKGLGLDSSSFGMIAIFIFIPYLLGGMISRKMQNYKISSDKIILHGISLMCIGSLIFTLTIYFNFINVHIHNIISLSMTLLFLSCVITGLTMIIPNALSQALENYSDFAGTAASLFGFSYCIIISLVTALMGYMHNGTLLQLPLFMLIVSISMILVYYATIRVRAKINF